MRIFIALLMGSIFVVLGFCAKLGIWRRWQAWQTDDGVPFLLRNAWAAMIPGGMAFVAVGVAGSMLPLRRDSLVIPSLALLIAFAGLTIAVLMAYRPPRWIKPRWLQRQEREEGEVQSSTVFDRILLVAMTISSVGAILLLGSCSLDRPSGNPDGT